MLCWRFRASVFQGRAEASRVKAQRQAPDQQLPYLAAALVADIAAERSERLSAVSGTGSVADTSEPATVDRTCVGSRGATRAATSE
jgi:hypothetical protein